MWSLLYPVHLLVKFGIILYDNELPGRQHTARVDVNNDAKVLELVYVFTVVGGDSLRTRPAFQHPSVLRSKQRKWRPPRLLHPSLLHLQP